MGLEFSRSRSNWPSRPPNHIDLIGSSMLFASPHPHSAQRNSMCNCTTAMSQDVTRWQEYLEYLQAKSAHKCACSAHLCPTLHPPCAKRWTVSCTATTSPHPAADGNQVVPPDCHLQPQVLKTLIHVDTMCRDLPQLKILYLNFPAGFRWMRHLIRHVELRNRLQESLQSNKAHFAALRRTAQKELLKKSCR